MKTSIPSGELPTKIFVLLFLLMPIAAFAGGGRQESGRDSGAETIEGGQFAGSSLIDAYEYINDYEFPYEIIPGEDLSVFVRLEKNQALSIGDNFSLMIGLRVNEQDHFSRNEGNYILFIHNPALLLQEEWRNAILSVLLRIRRAQQSDAILGIFNPITNQIINIPDTNAIVGALTQIMSTRKVYANDSILDESFKRMAAIDNNRNTRFLWITDSDLLRGNNSAAERAYFDFLIKLQSQNNISFSYMGYGEMPNWADMNSSLKNAGGNSYYVNTSNELQDKIWDDYNLFSYPTIEKIKVNVSLMPWITEARNDYRAEWYPVTGFTPTAAYYTHTQANSIKNMDAGAHRIYLYYLRIIAENRVFASTANEYLREIAEGRAIPTGFVSVEYYSFTQGKTIYRVFPFHITYTDDYDSYAVNIDQVVRKFTVLQNTAFILKELNQLVNNRNYYNAILLVDSQIKLLEQLADNDAEILADIETLKKNRDLLMEQARSLNYIR